MPYDLTVLTYRCADNAARFLPSLRQAAEVWNDVLSGLVELREYVVPARGINELNILVVMDSATFPVRTPQHPTRIAECRRIATDYWQITLSREVKWATSFWSRLFGNGENALATLVHELGHVFSLPHSADPAHVMHPDIGGNGKLSRREAEQYRVKFLQILDSQA